MRISLRLPARHFQTPTKLIFRTAQTGHTDNYDKVCMKNATSYLSDPIIAESYVISRVTTDT